VLSDLPAVEALGDQVPYNCPDCGGVLWEISKGPSLRYRCHTGHAFTAPVLLARQSEKVEETLWIALRMFEERRNLLRKMSSAKPIPAVEEGVPRTGNRELFASTAARAKEAEMHIERIRELLRVGESSGHKR
jgi:two-component system chemotaxis response regulator CheB